MIYTFQTVPGQTHVGPGPSLMTFFNDKSNQGVTMTPLYAHFDESTY